MNTFNRIISAGIVALMGIAGATTIFAQEDGATTFAQAENAPALVQNETPQEGPRNGGQRGELRELASQVFDQDEMKAVVADALGITVEELDAAKEAGTRLSELAEAQGVEVETVKAAVQAYRETAVADAIEAGIITEEQGEQLLNHEGKRRGKRAGRFGGLVDRADVQTAVADALGISVEDLQAAKEAGTSIEDLAAENGVEMETIQEAVQAVKETAVQEALEAGTITEEQAERILSGEGRQGRQGGPRGGNGPAPAPNADAQA